jgi:nucleotide-binding universal stress UspA family protein
MGHPIVAGLDGSRQSRAVASVAAGLARALGHTLILAHAVADPSSFRFPDAGERGRRRARAVENGFALLEGVAATLPDAVGQTAVVLGSPNEALASFCHREQAALLVIGSVDVGGCRLRCWAATRVQVRARWLSCHPTPQIAFWPRGGPAVQSCAGSMAP